ncbi:MAG: GNAT family N-acetyltransferase [Candidatus Pacebacteria bacterium]|nr:GNAT family N-acetyltransferase [Candidatus Paceibacterota bacterium]
MKVIFKKAVVGDLETFFALFQKNVQANFPEYSPKITRFIAEKEYTLLDTKAQFQAGIISIYLAFLGKEIIGFLMTRFLGGGVMLAEWLSVSECYQSRGIGTLLLRFWEKDAKKSGIHMLHLWADERVKKFYQKNGWQLLGRVPENFYGVDDYFLYKKIQQPKLKNFLQ